MIKPRRSWHWVKAAWAAVSGTVLLFAAFAGWEYWLFKGGVFRTSSFIEAKWRAQKRGSGDPSCYRGMAIDLQTTILLPGLAKAEVKRLLGAPDYAEANVAEYALGMCSGLGIDLDTLNVHFDAGDKVDGVQIVQN
jgi:hypothetical protein